VEPFKPSWEFVVEQGPESGRHLVLPSERFVIGSAPDCGLVFPPSAVREKHAEIRWSNGAFEVRDLTGANLVWVDGRCVGFGSLSAGTLLRVGRVELRLTTLDETVIPGRSFVSDATLHSQPRLNLEGAPAAEAPSVDLRATPAGQLSQSGRVSADRVIPTTASGRFVVGDVIDARYRIISRIAAGGMGEVYRVEHVELGKALALKVMLPTLDADREFVNRFKIEAVAASRIGHPNIVDISDFGRTSDGRFYFVMEFLDGETLSSLVRREGAQPVDRAVNLTLQAARALAAAHALRIIHRDLKPENVMVLRRAGNPDVVKVLDFGVARVQVDNESVGKTAAGIVVGTPQYMSPEQAKAVVVDERSDIYSLGLILHELVSGSPAFTGETPPIVMVKQVTEAPPPLATHIPFELRELVAHMLAKDPNRRPQTMNAVVERLEAVRSQLVGGSDAGLKTRDAPLTQPGGRAVSHRRLSQVQEPAENLGTVERVTTGGDTADEPLPEPQPIRPTRWPLMMALGVGLLVATAVTVGLVVIDSRKDTPPASVEVVEANQVDAPKAPVVVGSSENAAEVPVKIVSSPAGAEVLEAGLMLGSTPLVMTRKVGSIADLELRLSGYTPLARRVLVSKEVSEVAFALEPKREMPLPSKSAPKPSEPKKPPPLKPMPGELDLKPAPF
jgi:serine/threonine-protein kinase